MSILKIFLLIGVSVFVAKNKVFSGLVKDPELKAILDEDLELSKKAIKDFRKLLADSEK